MFPSQRADYGDFTALVAPSFAIKTNSNSDIIVQATVRFTEIIQQTKYVLSIVPSAY